MLAVDEQRNEVAVKPLCVALGVGRETYYRRKRPALPRAPRVRPRPARALGVEEQQQVLEVLNSERFVNRAPAEVHATLLDEGVYHCAVRTIYRVLSAHGEVRARRDELRHPQYKKPELLATAPNQVWSWDITKLLGPVKWSYFHLYVLLDIFSRYVVGWMLARSESAELARRLIRESCERQGIDRDQLILHSDRGTSMKSKTVAQMLADLGVERSLSRPHVSNDNPFSEAQFKTLKYGPGFPDRFAGGFDHGLGHCREFFPWYNDEHHHSALGWLTPAQVHYGRAAAVLDGREQVLRRAYLAHPERFVSGPPRPASPPTAVWINPPTAPHVELPSLHSVNSRDEVSHDR
ncbi:MAG: integrase catalytic subunit [Limisphaerales bacterium]|nr:MAG: integrase catalytic subunit [Limisphaerales bacterium]